MCCSEHQFNRYASTFKSRHNYLSLAEYIYYFISSFLHFYCKTYQISSYHLRWHEYISTSVAKCDNHASKILPQTYHRISSASRGSGLSLCLLYVSVLMASLKRDPSNDRDGRNLFYTPPPHLFFAKIFIPSRQTKDEWEGRRGNEHFFIYFYISLSPTRNFIFQYFYFIFNLFLSSFLTGSVSFLSLVAQ